MTTGDRLFDMRVLNTLNTVKEKGLKLKNDESVTLIVMENPSTGYSWQIDTEGVKGLWTVDAVHTAAERTERTRHFTGMPGTKTITLHAHATKEGEGVFRAAYVRPWEFTSFDHVYSGNLL